MSEAEKGVGQQGAEARCRLEKPAGAAASLPDRPGEKCPATFGKTRWSSLCSKRCIRTRECYRWLPTHYGEVYCGGC
jgi:hypothetical protein